MSRILLGVSGGIAAYKALELVRLATAAGHELRVVQTPASRRFVGTASFAALSGAPVLVSEFERDPMRGAFPGQKLPDHEPLSHLELVANAELLVIAPASANTIAKLACGLADNLLCNCALAADCPVVIAPAMNARMYEHAATQANLRTLEGRAAIVVAPDSGRLASKGEEGVGRLADPPRLLAVIEDALAPPARDANDASAASARDASWRGLRVLVTAGGTREPIDSVRFIGNSSSGRMGVALAEAAYARGARVTLIAANIALQTSAGIARREVDTAAALGQACEQEFAASDVLLMTAAVADFAPAGPLDHKIKKGAHDTLELLLEPTADVLAGLASRRTDGQTIVGFAAEHGERAVELAREKLLAKRLDALVVNDISRTDIGFDAPDNEVTVLTAEDAGVRELHVPRAPKREVAEAILDAVARLRGAG